MCQALLIVLSLKLFVTVVTCLAFLFRVKYLMLLHKLL
jgi:hypothetical protein